MVSAARPPLIALGSLIVGTTVLTILAGLAVDLTPTVFVAAVRALGMIGALLVLNTMMITAAAALATLACTRLFGALRAKHVAIGVGGGAVLTAALGMWRIATTPAELRLISPLVFVAIAAAAAVPAVLTASLIARRGLVTAEALRGQASRSR